MSLSAVILDFSMSLGPARRWDCSQGHVCLWFGGKVDRDYLSLSPFCLPSTIEGPMASGGFSAVCRTHTWKVPFSSLSVWFSLPDFILGSCGCITGALGLSHVSRSVLTAPAVDIV